MTETGVTHLNKNNEYRYKSVGKALELTETKVQLYTSMCAFDTCHIPRL